MGMRERTATGLTAPAVHGPSKSGKDNVAKSWTPTQSTFLKATTLLWTPTAEPENPMENQKSQIKTLPLSRASPQERLCLPVAGLNQYSSRSEPSERGTLPGDSTPRRTILTLTVPPEPEIGNLLEKRDKPGNQHGRHKLRSLFSRKAGIRVCRQKW